MLSSSVEELESLLAPVLLFTNHLGMVMIKEVDRETLCWEDATNPN